MSRSKSRNVWIEFASEPGVIKGGLCAASNLTRAQFLDMLSVLFSANGGFQTRHYEPDASITSTNQHLQHGRYILTPRVPGEEIRVSDKTFFPRTLSLSNTTRDVEFRDQIRQRDGRCVITDDINYEAIEDRWVGFQTAHIIPLSLNHIFTGQGFSHLITHNNPPGINSPQNGILLHTGVHPLWDDYSIAVNPNDGYRVHSFRPNAWKHHGRILHPACRNPNNPLSVVDALLSWHYEQAVLCNMRGEGEASFEFDFPPGTDMMGEIRNGPQPRERMEVELFNRLHGWEGQV